MCDPVWSPSGPNSPQLHRLAHGDRNVNEVCRIPVVCRSALRRAGATPGDDYIIIAPVAREQARKRPFELYCPIAPAGTSSLASGDGAAPETFAKVGRNPAMRMLRPVRGSAAAR